jgi:hypothetical protein
MFLIGVAPASAQIDVAVLVGIGGFLAVLLAIAFVLQVVTAPRNDHDAVASGPADAQRGSAG